MRIAVIPNLTFTNLEGESEFLMLRQIVRDIVKQYPSSFFAYFVIPSWSKLEKRNEPNVKYLVDEYDDYLCFHDRIAAVPMKFREWFNMRNGKYMVDAVYTTRTAAVPMIGKQIRDFRNSAYVPIFIDENMSLDKTTMYFKYDEDLIARTLGYFVAEHSFFDTDFEKERAIRAARRYLSGWAVNKMLERVSVIPCGINVERIQKLVSGVKKSKKFRVLCGNRLNESKRPEQMLRLYNQFFSFGRDVEIVITSPKAGKFFEREGVKRDSKHIVFLKNLSSDEFVKQVAMSHVVIETTQFGGFSLGLSEVIVAGAVVILPRLKWIKVLLGDLWEEYPFIYRNFDEAAMMLRYVYENYDEACRKAEKLRQFWIESYNSRKRSLQVFGVIRETVERIGVNKSNLWSKRNIELIRRSAEELGDEFSFGDILKKIIELGELYRKDDFEQPLRGRLSKWAVYKWLCMNGWRDNCVSEEPYFVREGSS